MKLLVRGKKDRWLEWQGALAANVSASYDENRTLNPNEYELVAELNLDDEAERLKSYSDFKGWLMISATKSSLLNISIEQGGAMPLKVLGMNALPTFIGRKSMEYTLLNHDLKEEAASLILRLGFIPELVKDRIGLVTPRIVFMIINEAFYVLQEGTASEADIDTGMKLGTNYPMGPFEWCAKAGIANVYETLEALWHDTHEERYKICPLLKERYLQETGIN